MRYHFGLFRFPVSQLIGLCVRWHWWWVGVGFFEGFPGDSIRGLLIPWRSPKGHQQNCQACDPFFADFFGGILCMAWLEFL